MAKKPLEDVKVIDFSRVAAGPFCTVMLAQFGAEVISIEPPNYGRGNSVLSGPMVPNLHHSKNSITIDLKSDEADDIIYELIDEADVVVHNYRPETMERLGYGYEALKEVNSDIIYCSITGFGEVGPYQDRPAFDPIAQAMSGLMSTIGEPDQKPSRIGASVIDFSTGLYAAYGIMIALWTREETGEGQKVEASLLDTAASFMGYWYTYYDKTGKKPQRQGHTWDMYAPVGVFNTSDKPIYLSVMGQELWERFCRTLNREEWIDNPNFATDEDRVLNRDELYQMIEEELSEYTRDDILELLFSNSIPASELYTVDEAVEDEHMRQRGTITRIKDVDGEEVLISGPPVHLSESPPSIMKPPSKVGGDAREILLEHGFSEGEINDLFNNKTIK